MTAPIASTRGSAPEVPSWERRSLPRVAIDLPVELYLDGVAGSLVARTRDLGVGGVCILTPHRFALAGLRRVRLLHPAARLTIDVEAHWQREAPGEEGFFTGVSWREGHADGLDPLWDLVGDQTKSLVRFLARDSDLRGLGLSELIELAQLTRLRTLQVGRRLYTQGQEALGTRSVFVVTEGTVVLEMRSKRHRRCILARLGRGDLFGGLGALGRLTPFESAIADCDVSLLEISETALAKLRRTNPSLLFQLAEVGLAADVQRLRSALQGAVDGGGRRR